MRELQLNSRSFVSLIGRSSYEAPRLIKRLATGLLLNGWQISGMTRLNTGPLFDVVISQDVARSAEMFLLSAWGQP